MKPTFWLSNIAKLLFIIVIATLIYILVVFYKRRLNLRNFLILEKERIKKDVEMNEDKLQFYANITHELKTPLTLMLGPLEDLQNEIGRAHV